MVCAVRAPEMPVAGQAADTAAAAPGKAGAGFTGATENVAGNLPKVPDAPLPAVAPPVSVPLVGSSAPHTADPTVCGILGGIIVVNWIIACCCAGAGAAGGAAAGAEAAEGDTSGAEAAGAAGGVAGAFFACIECLASICSIIALVYAAATGLFRAWLGGQAVSGWCLAMAIISSLQLLACVCICCATCGCAACGAAILGEKGYEKYVNEHSKYVFGSHMHELVHKHKPGGTHPITEGHLPLHDHIHNHIPLAKAGPAPKKGKDQAATYGSTQAESAPAAAPDTQPAAAAPEAQPAAAAPAQAEPAAAPAPAPSA